MKYCSLYIDKFGKYEMTVRIISNGSLKIIKEVNKMDHIKAKRMLVNFGVQEQEAEMAIREMEDKGLDHCDFTLDGKIGYLDFLGIVH